VTLVRVYCGLALAGNAASAADAQSWLTMAIVDDSGRLLDLCDINDDPDGYAELCGLFANRSGDPGTVAIATEQDKGCITQLLHTVGSYVAHIDGKSATTYAEQFGDDESVDEIASSPAERRAIGLARAVQAGMIWASPQATPPDLIVLKPLLAAHAALVAGRLQAAGALREVLRELYPAALRAYADPAERVSLAVLHALPDGGQLASSQNGRARENQIVTELVDAGVAEKSALAEAVIALRVAVSETPRRSGVTRAITAASAAAVRQSVAAVISYDTAADGLISLITDRVAGASRSTDSGPPWADSGPQMSGAAPLRVVSDEHGSVAGPTESRRSRAEDSVLARATADTTITPAGDLTKRPLIDTGGRAPDGPSGDLPFRPSSPVAPAASALPNGTRGSLPTTIPASTRQGRGDVPRTPYTPPGPRIDSPVSPAAPPTPTSTPDSPGHVFEPAAYLSAPPLRFDPSQGYTTDRNAGTAMPRLSPELPAPGSRSTWPLEGGNGRSEADQPVSPAAGAADLPRPVELPRQREGRVTPPWQADDLPSEPPILRLVEPGPIADPALAIGPTFALPARASEASERAASAELPADPPTLRLVESDREDLSVPRVDDPTAGPADDSDLLIFTQCKSAWFTDVDDVDVDERPPWQTAADTGWRAAEQAASPQVGADTGAGLPRRVPQQNLVPGSPMPTPERSLRIVRDAAAIAAHTSGYFRGYRRGQEVGGYAVGGRPGRESAGGWDFSREVSSGDRDYGGDGEFRGYRSAGP
jgi:hypothetical protein